MEERIKGRIGGPWGKLSPRLPQMSLMKRLGRNATKCTSCGCFPVESRLNKMFD